MRTRIWSTPCRRIRVFLLVLTLFELLFPVKMQTCDYLVNFTGFSPVQAPRYSQITRLCIMQCINMFIIVLVCFSSMRLWRRIAGNPSCYRIFCSRICIFNWEGILKLKILLISILALNCKLSAMRKNGLGLPQWVLPRTDVYTILHLYRATVSWRHHQDP